MSDSGLVDFEISGEKGLSLDIVMVPFSDANGVRGIKVQSCNCSIEHFGLRVHDTTKHRMVYKLFKGTIQKMAKKAIETSLCQQITEMLRIP